MDSGQVEQAGVSCDTLFAGRLHCLQHRSGYRFSVDAILAAHFSPPLPGATVLDLGGGCGVIALICLYRWQQQIASVSCLELQPGLAGLASRNMAMNGYADKMKVVQGDLRNILDFFPAESFSQVICNPPFYKKKFRQTLSGSGVLCRPASGTLYPARGGGCCRGCGQESRQGGLCLSRHRAERLAGDPPSTPSRPQALADHLQLSRCRCSRPAGPGRGRQEWRRGHAGSAPVLYLRATVGCVQHGHAEML